MTTTTTRKPLRRYGLSHRDQEGVIENPRHCIMAVDDPEQTTLRYQCGERRGHGPAGLFCTEHAGYAQSIMDGAAHPSDQDETVFAAFWRADTLLWRPGDLIFGFCCADPVPLPTYTIQEIDEVEPEGGITSACLDCGQRWAWEYPERQ